MADNKTDQPLAGNANSNQLFSNSNVDVPINYGDHNVKTICPV